MVLSIIKNHRNVLSVLLAVAIFPGIWVGQGLGHLTLPGEIIGVTIALESLVVQYYFRKKPSGEVT